jgi:MFS transporter, PAT family, beta-lactamase induction signal transducer AmpG
VITLQNNRHARMATLCALYVAQGIPFGFVVVTLKAILADRGLETTQIGDVMALATLPWAFKWAWGPIIDLVGIPRMGRRRPWILFAQALMVVTIGAMIALPDLAGAVGTLGWLVFVHNCFNSMQDVAVDALAVDLLPEEERGKANGLMYGSKYLGTVIGGAGLATVMKASNLQVALLVQTAALGLIFLLPLLLRERESDAIFDVRVGMQERGDGDSNKDGLATIVAMFRDLFKAFSVRSTLIGGVFALLALAPNGILGTVGANLFTKEIGWDATFYAQIEGTAYMMGLGGAVFGGFVADWIGIKRTVALGYGGLGLLYLLFGLAQPYWQIDAVPIAFLYIEPLFSSMGAVGCFALFMSISWPRVGATQFTAYMAMLNLSTTIGQKFAGPLDDRFDSPTLFLLCGGAQIAIIVLLPLVDPQQARRRFGVAAVEPPAPAG